MSQLYINPYINFDGQAREAMEFYHQALGGKLELSAFDPSGAPKPAGPGDKIMHSRLEADGAIIMGSDGMDSQPKREHGNLGIAFGGSESARLHKAFDALAQGGKVTKPLAKESWGDEFGMLTDKFGINWLVNISKET
jgi:PhnB protein